MIRKIFDDLKEEQFQIFLVMKLGLEEIRHKKIVHKIFSNYKNGKQIVIEPSFDDMDEEQLEEVCESIDLINKYQMVIQYVQFEFNNYFYSFFYHEDFPNYFNKFAKCFEKLKYSKVKELYIDLGTNYFGEWRNIPNLSKAISSLKESQLQVFSIDISQNNIGSKDYLKLIGEALIQIINTGKLQELDIGLSGNQLYDSDELQYLVNIIDAIKNSNTIREFSIDLCGNGLAGNQGILKKILDSILKMLETKQQLQSVQINLNRNRISEYTEQVEVIDQFVPKLQQCGKIIILDLQDNQLKDHVKKMENYQKYLENKNDQEKLTILV